TKIVNVVVDTKIPASPIVNAIGPSGNVPSFRSSNGDDAGLTRSPSGQIGPNNPIPSRNVGTGPLLDNSGVANIKFNPPGGVVTQNSVENDASVPDPVFSYPDPSSPGNRINTRRVTGRNTPSAVNAVFNFRNFWDGRAQNVCNGNNPFGARDAAS